MSIKMHLATWESSFCKLVMTSSHRFYPIQVFISNPHLSPILPALYKMELWARELAENGDSILYVDRSSLSVIGVGRLHAFGGISRQGTTLLGLGQSRRALPDISGGIVLPFIETVGQHSIFTDGCPMH